MYCKYCKKDFSDKVYRIHLEYCKHKYDNIIKEANEITLDKASKTDLIVYICSESDDYDEIELKKCKKSELLEIANNIK